MKFLEARQRRTRPVMVARTHHAKYARAAAFLRDVLSADAPDTSALINLELTHRRPRLIAETYLDFHGFPALDVLRKRRRAEQRAGLQPRRILPGGDTTGRSKARRMERVRYRLAERACSEAKRRF